MRPLLEFPCKLTIKAMGLNQNDFAAHIVQLLRKFVPGILEGDISSRLSKEGRYLAVSVRLMLESKELADLIYQALSADDRVIMAI